MTGILEPCRLCCHIEDVGEASTFQNLAVFPATSQCNGLYTSSLVVMKLPERVASCALYQRQQAHKSETENSTYCLFFCAEPSPGSLVLSPGSTLVLTCSGHVMVDGVKVRNGSNSGKRHGSQTATQTALNNISKTQVWIKSEKRTDAANQGPSGTNRSLGHTASSGAHTVRPTSARSLLKADDTDAEEEDEEEMEGGSRVTRGIKSRHQWKWTRRTGGKGDKDIAWTREDALLLSPVRLTDSGTYTCSYRGRDMSTFKVIVAGGSHSRNVHNFAFFGCFVYTF